MLPASTSLKVNSTLYSPSSAIEILSVVRTFHHWGGSLNTSLLSIAEYVMLLPLWGVHPSGLIPLLCGVIKSPFSKSSLIESV